MLHILVIGGYDSESGIDSDIQEFAGLLGGELAKQGHVLVNACRTRLDKRVAEGAYNKLLELDENPQEKIISYIMQDEEPIHKFGIVRESQLEDWELGSPDLKIPEPIELADVIIMMGGYQGTHRAANWARIANKPILPISRFGGASRDIYNSELNHFSNKYASKIAQSDYENLADVGSDLELLATNVVSLCENIKTSNDVFVIMSFSDDDALEDAYDTFQTVCNDANYKCSRVDDSSDVTRIVPEITKRISESAFSIIDLTEQKVNVYYELGYAEALGKPFIITAKQGSELPFDVADIPVIFWKNQKELCENLKIKIQHIAEKQGR